MVILLHLAIVFVNFKLILFSKHFFFLNFFKVPGIYDLTCTTENWRRDFANGYIVARILHHYDPKNIQLRSFRNGNSTVQKR